MDEHSAAVSAKIASGLFLKLHKSSADYGKIESISSRLPLGRPKKIAEAALRAAMNCSFTNREEERMAWKSVRVRMIESWSLKDGNSNKSEDYYTVADYYVDLGSKLCFDRELYTYHHQSAKIARLTPEEART